MREHLLGYLLGALEGAEAREVESALQVDDQLRRDLERLKRRVAPLGASGPFEPPAGLALRTLNRLESLLDEAAPADIPSVGSTSEGRPGAVVAVESEPVQRPPNPVVSGPVVSGPVVSGPAFSAQSEPRRGNARSLSLVDAVVALGIVAAAALLMFTFIASSRYQSQLLACQRNLQQLGQAFQSYGETQGVLPFPSRNPQLAVVGMYATLLRDRGLVEGASAFVCPAADPKGQWATWQPPSVDELLVADPNRLSVLHRTMGGTYGYQLSFVRDGQVQQPRDLRRPHYALLADIPSSAEGNYLSGNHGGRGQNVLFEDGRVDFLSHCTVGRDHIFLSDRGRVEPGRHQDDAVVAVGWTSPFPTAAY